MLLTIISSARRYVRSPVWAGERAKNFCLQFYTKAKNPLPQIINKVKGVLKIETPIRFGGKFYSNQGKNRKNNNAVSRIFNAERSKITSKNK